jgi:hypothetical protein
VSEPTLPRDPEGLRSRTIWLVAAATVAVAVALTGIAWLLVVVPNGSPAASQPSSLRHDLLETARDGADSRAAAMRTLDRTEWIDRNASIVHIPIDQAIDAVVADPALIGGGK